MLQSQNKLAIPYLSEVKALTCNIAHKMSRLQVYFNLFGVLLEIILDIFLSV